MAKLNKIEMFLYGIAERMDWHSYPPRKFWARLLRHYDRKVYSGPPKPCDDVKTSPPPRPESR